MPRQIVLEPVDPTPALMDKLQQSGLIIRLCPGAHELPAKPGETLGASIYESDPGFGPHKLITVTVNRPGLPGFGTHPDNEEFLMIGSPAARPLFLVIAWDRREELDRKALSGALSAADFVALRVRWNDPETSFFVMLKDTVHGECAAAGVAAAPSFYVTESRDLPLDRFDLHGVELVVGE